MIPMVHSISSAITSLPLYGGYRLLENVMVVEENVEINKS